MGVLSQYKNLGLIFKIVYFNVIHSNNEQKSQTKKHVDLKNL